MSRPSLLIANRGEIAVRVLRAASDLGMRTVAVFSEDDASGLHVRLADEAVALRGGGARAYLDDERILEAARASGCGLLHPGYGFRSESGDFARACESAGVVFVGPRPDTLDLFGDKARARELASRLRVPILEGTERPTSLEEARAFLNSLGVGGAILIKAVAGGGGRGMRAVTHADDLDEAFARCRSEAASAFGADAVYVERRIPRARHLEVQMVGDGAGRVVSLGERECTLQRRNQKLVEIAPSPWISAEQRAALVEAAVRMAAETRLRSLATFEFLMDTDRGELVFLEANPRLQVEHTVTEEVMGLDLVSLQLRLATGSSFEDLGLDAPRVGEPRGFAIEVRVNMETMGPDGSPRPGVGTIHVFEPPAGPGVRVDSAAYSGYAPPPSFDSLLAKIICHSSEPDFAAVARKTRRALGELRVSGVPTNVAFLERLVSHPDFLSGEATTGFVEERIEELVSPVEDETLAENEPRPRKLAGVKVDAADPLAVLAYGKEGPSPARSSLGGRSVPDGMVAVEAPMQGTVVTIDAAVGDAVKRGQLLCVLEAMKMEHVVSAPFAGVVRRIGAAPGDAVYGGHLLLLLEPSGLDEGEVADLGTIDLDAIRPDLAEVLERQAITLDPARPEAVRRRHDKGHRTARENVDDLCDPGSFIEYGQLVIAAQRRRRSVQDLIERTPADGLVAGIGRVNGDLFDDEKSRCAVLAYDYTVLAGTQGMQNHRKKDRLFELADEWRLPLVFFTEGGGGRPGDTDAGGVGGLDTLAFHLFARLSGYVPLVGINSGRCFAGNAALLGCCDVVIATESSSIGMGGPAMIEGGGLGVFHPDEIGPLSVQVPNGVVDVAVADEVEAVRVAKRYLSYFQGALPGWECDDQRRLRSLVPENRLRAYDVRRVIETLCDVGSVLELRRGFGHGMVTALARIEGRPVGILANDATHLAGAIDAEGADKACRFVGLLDAFDVPLVNLCDTPGIMVGPEVEKTALVRRATRLFLVGANASIPTFTVVLRKAYGLGAMAMAAGTFKAPFFTVSWPTGEFGGMGLEGMVKLGFRSELAAIEDPEERKRVFEQMVAQAYEHGKALNAASWFEIDHVIDPAETRRWIVTALRSLPPVPARSEKKHPIT